MNNVRMKDVALVAVAGGRLAFELVSLGEVLPSATRAFANRGLPKAARVAMITGPRPYSLARTVRARSPYFAFIDSMNKTQ